MNRKISILVILIIVFLTGCNSGGTEANLAAIDIPLPYQDGYVQDMKITEDGNLTLAMYETMNGEKKAKATVWQTSNDGENWEQLYEEYFEPNNPNKETVEILMYFAGDGLIITKHDYIGDSLEVTSEEAYYIDEFNNGSRKLSASNSIKDFGGRLIYNNNGIYINIYNEEDGQQIVRLDPDKETLTDTGIVGKDEYEYVYYMSSGGDRIYCICSVAYEGTKEEKEGTVPVDTSKYIKGRIYDTATGEISESELLNKAAVLFYEKWKGENQYSYTYMPVFCSNISSEEESYLLAHNDGVYMIDSDETKLLYKDKNWKGSSNQISDILMNLDGDIYVHVYLDNYADAQLIKISEGTHS